MISSYKILASIYRSKYLFFKLKLILSSKPVQLINLLTLLPTKFSLCLKLVEPLFNVLPNNLKYNLIIPHSKPWNMKIFILSALAGPAKQARRWPASPALRYLRLLRAPLSTNTPRSAP